MDNILIVRLKNGDDVICNSVMEESNNICIMESPMKINLFRDPRTPNRPFIAMSPWLPVHIIQQNRAEIAISEILTSMVPDPELSEYYSNSVHAYEDSIRADADAAQKFFEDDEEGDEEGFPGGNLEEDIATVAYLKKENLLN